MGWIALLALLLCLGLVAPAVALEPSAAVFSDPRIIKIGDKLFAKNCSRGYCHGKDGRAGRGPRFRGRTLDKSYMFKVTRQGVPGTSMAPVGENSATPRSGPSSPIFPRCRPSIRRVSP